MPLGTFTVQSIVYEPKIRGVPCYRVLLADSEDSYRGFRNEVTLLAMGKDEVAPYSIGKHFRLQLVADED